MRNNHTPAPSPAAAAAVVAAVDVTVPTASPPPNRSPAISSGARVIGDVPCCSTHRTIAVRSYTKPSSAATGSTSGSFVMGHVAKTLTTAAVVLLSSCSDDGEDAVAAEPCGARDDDDMAGEMTTPYVGWAGLWCGFIVGACHGVATGRSALMCKVVARHPLLTKHSHCRDLASREFSGSVGCSGRVRLQVLCSVNVASVSAWPTFAFSADSSMLWLMLLSIVVLDFVGRLLIGLSSRACSPCSS